jgi:hypothetical protein
LQIQLKISSSNPSRLWANASKIRAFEPPNQFPPWTKTPATPLSAPRRRPGAFCRTTSPPSLKATCRQLGPRSFEATGRTFEATGRTFEATGRTFEATGRTFEATGRTFEATGRTFEATGRTFEATGRTFEATGRTFEATGRTYSMNQGNSDDLWPWHGARRPESTRLLTRSRRERHHGQDAPPRFHAAMLGSSQILLDQRAVFEKKPPGTSDGLGGRSIRPEVGGASWQRPITPSTPEKEKPPSYRGFGQCEEGESNPHGS